MIDWNRLEELRAEIGHEALAEVVSLFLEETDQEVALLRAGTPGRGIEESLHFLKGSALNLGLSDLARVCIAGEKALATGAAQVDLAAILRDYDRSRAAFVRGLAARMAA